MLLDDSTLQETADRLDFDPRALGRELAAKAPIENEDPARKQLRMSQAVAVAGEAVSLDLERILNRNDLLSINYLDKGLLASSAIGRILVTDEDGQLLGYGTGSMISPRLMLTNNHVLRDYATAASSQIQFNYQLDAKGKAVPPESFDLRPDEFFQTDKALDFTIVAVAPVSQSGKRQLSEFGWLRVNREVGKVSPGESLTIIQHPGGNPKQIAVRENQLLKIETNFLWYMTDTAPGSSGSPVFNDQWQIVALHHSGVPAKDAQGNWLTIDGKIWDSSMDESRIKWVANEGVRISRIVNKVESASGAHPLVRQFLDRIKAIAPEVVAIGSVDVSSSNGHVAHGGGAPLPSTDFPHLSGRTTVGAGGGAATATADAVVTVGGPPDATDAPHVADGGLSVEVPLTISVRLGRPGAHAGNGHGNGRPDVGTAAPPTPDAGEAVSIDPNYPNRSGYRANFLGTGARRVPLPVLSPALQAKAAVNRQAAVGADPYVLPYHHFSIAMNRERKMAFYTAVNIDGRVSFRVRRETDRWIKDPRIGRDEQTGESLYAGNPLDRGHLVRRLDPAWGDSFEVAKFANDDTFHFTNCTPQHQGFNQNQDTWAGLEDYILNNADNEDFKVSVFTGPVLRAADPVYRDVRLPRQFWKVVVMVKPGGQLSATAYLLSQAGLLQDLEEAFVFGPYKTFQVKVRRVEQLTGLSFGNLRTFDPKENLEADAAVEINSYSDLDL